MISWQVQGPLAHESFERAATDISRAMHDSGLLVAYELGQFPFELMEAGHEIAGVPWRDVYVRGRWGGGGPGEVAQLFDYLYLNIWPFAKIAGELAGAGAVASFGGKAGADAWERCKQGLKRAVRPILERCARTVVIDVAESPDPQDDGLYEVHREDLDSLDDAIDAIVDHAQTRFRAGGPRGHTHLHWNSKTGRMESSRHDRS